jgi:hypothetical protein
MAMAKAVSDAGQGGMVVLSHDAFIRCNLEALQDVRVFHMWVRHAGQGSGPLLPGT